MNQARRGLADTALSLGVDVSSRIGILYAPPAAWSHGYLWGANVVTIPRDAPFSPQTNEVTKPNNLGGGGLDPGPADRYALKLDSPTAVRTLNAPARGRRLGAARARLVHDARRGDATRRQRDLRGRPGDEDEPGRDRSGRGAVGSSACQAAALPALEPMERVPRIAVLVGAVDQSIWTLRNLGFTADPVSVGTINAAADDPLLGYDLVYNTGNWPSAANPVAQTRLTEFFARGGGYLGAGTGGANFLTAGAPGDRPDGRSRGGNGRSGIIWWDNTGGAESPVVGAYPARDTAIVDPPTWFTSVPATMTVDAQLPLTGFFAAGLWALDAQSATAPGSAVIAHGANTARHGAADRVRDEPALPGRPGTGVARGGHVGLLGRPVAPAGLSGAAAAPPPTPTVRSELGDAGE